MWWGWRDSNSQGLPHTALNRARIPIPPHPHKFTLSNSSYLTGAVGAPVFAPLAGVAAGVVAAGALVFCGAPVLAAPSVAGAVAGDAAGEACGEGVGFCSSSETVCNTERCPVMAGKESASATSMKSMAAPMVTFASRVCVPRGPNAVLETLLEKSAPASALPGCRSTATMSTMHDRMKSMYRTLIN